MLDRWFFVLVFFVGCGDSAGGMRVSDATTSTAGSDAGRHTGDANLPQRSDAAAIDASGPAQTHSDRMWRPADCDNTGWQQVRSVDEQESCRVCGAPCCEEANHCGNVAWESYGRGNTAGSGCEPYLSCSARCLYTQLDKGVAYSANLLADCVQACLDYGGNEPPSGWLPQFAPALRDYLQCYLAAPALIVVDLDGNPASPITDEDAGWTDPANPTPYRWAPVSSDTDAGNGLPLPGGCFETCVTCSDNAKEAGAGCPVFCDKNPGGAGCLAQ